VFLTSVLHGDDRPSSRPGRFIPGERTSGTRLIGDWVGPRVGLEAVAKRKEFVPLPGIEPDRPAYSSLTILTKLCWHH